MRAYVRRQTAALLSKFAEEIDRAANDHGAEAIHDLRVSIRRLSRCLRAFSQFYPGRSWKKARTELSELLHAAGAVRDRDIALELLGKAGVAQRSPVVARLQVERARAHNRLIAEIKGWRDDKRADRWKRRLEV
jgi:CHAD domain-containing protein